MSTGGFNGNSQIGKPCEAQKLCWDCTTEPVECKVSMRLSVVKTFRTYKLRRVLMFPISGSKVPFKEFLARCLIVNQANLVDLQPQDIR